MTCNCPKCSYTTTNDAPAPTPTNNDTFYIRQKSSNEMFAITGPADLSVKHGGVVVTTEFYAPNYLSINDDKWVRSCDGAVLTCEQLFEALAQHNCNLIYLSDYDFQGM